jgi:predicted nucleic acid-binding protein
VKIREALHDIRVLGLDVAPIIYYVENQIIRAEKVDTILQLLDERELRFVASVIALTETLSKPIQVKDTLLVASYLSLFHQSKKLDLISVTHEMAESAAHLRARYNLRTPDALHLVSSLHAGCHGFLTNDATLKRVTEIRVLVLDELNL